MRRRISRKKSKKTLLFSVLLLVLVGGLIGYASLNRVLTIEGETTVSKNVWNVRFENVNVLTNNAIVETAPNIIDNGSKVNFVIKLDKPGDSYSFTVDVVNNGDIDAMLGTTNLIDELSTKTNYLDYKLSYIDGVDFTKGDLLKKGTIDTIKFTVTFKKDITAADLETSSEQALNITLTNTYVQADNTAAVREKLVQLPAGKTKDNLVLGDEITIGTEPFNFIRYDGNNIVMLAKWNLNVGNNPKTAETFKQDSDVKGWVSSGTTYGNVAFSATNYWSSITTYPADVYDNTYKTAPDFTGSGYSTTGYSVAYYVEKYKKILEDMGLTISEARLLTYTEATDSTIGIGCDGSNYSCPTTGFITNTSFWLGSANGGGGLWVVGSVGYFSSSSFSGGYYYGVRPVIVISKSEV